MASSTKGAGHGPGPGRPAAGVAARLRRRPRAVRRGTAPAPRRGPPHHRGADRADRAGYVARTLGDLDALATDLPPLRPPAPRPAPPGYAGPPGYTGPTPTGWPPATQAAAKAALYRSILWFGSLSVLVLIIWAMTNFGGYFWPIWPILGFAIAIGWQAFNVYGPRPPGERRP